MRLERLDILRGIAIILMVLFHLNYTLVNIFHINILNVSVMFWYYLGRVSALWFMSIAGISFFLASKKYEKLIFKKYWIYAVYLSGISALITLGTYILIPEELILFGILHFFALSFFLLPFFRVFWKYNFLIAGVILFGSTFIPVVQNTWLFPLWFTAPGFWSADYYPIFPYFGVLLLGYSFWIFFEKYNLWKILQQKKELNFLERILSYAGKHSLLIYLMHQPIIIGSLFLAKMLYLLVF